MPTPKRNSKTHQQYAQSLKTMENLRANQRKLPSCLKVTTKLPSAYQMTARKLSTHLSPLKNLMIPDHLLTSVTTTTEDIIAAINKITPNAAAGPDGLLKNCKHQLALPLQLLCDMSLQTGSVPWLLKTGIVTPIYKGGSRGLAKNYRPVVLTSHLIKVMERSIRAKLIIYMEAIEAFNEGQHGFRQDRSCLSQLLAHYKKILLDIHDGNNVDVIYRLRQSLW